MPKSVLSAAEFAREASNSGVDLFNTNEQGQLVTNDTSLRRDEWERLDDTLLNTANKYLTIVDDLRAAGLVVNLGGLGVIISVYERVSDMTDAAISMDGVAESEYDKLVFDEVGVPIPIIHKDWILNRRQLEASRKRGEPISVVGVRVATRIVSEKIEKMIINGAPIQVDGKTIYGLTNHPNRNTLTMTGSGWTTVSGRDPVLDIIRAITALRADNFYGPYNIYVSDDIWPVLMADYSTTKGEKTYLERIKSLAGIANIKPLSFLANNTVIVISMTEETIDLAVAQDIINIVWNINPMQFNYKVFGAMAPRLKADKTGNMGLVHLS